MIEVIDSAATSFVYNALRLRLRKAFLEDLQGAPEWTNTIHESLRSCTTVERLRIAILSTRLDAAMMPLGGSCARPALSTG
jgi:hypothetical protein